MHNQITQCDDSLTITSKALKLNTEDRHASGIVYKSLNLNMLTKIAYKLYIAAKSGLLQPHDRQSAHLMAAHEPEEFHGRTVRLHACSVHEIHNLKAN